MDINTIHFLTALHEAIEGKTEMLVEYLRSELPLQKPERELLIKFVTGNLKGKRGRGRPKLDEGRRRLRKIGLDYHHPLYGASQDFDRILKVWRVRHKKKYGVREKAVEMVANRHGVEFERLNNYLRRRRSPKRTK